VEKYGAGSTDHQHNQGQHPENEPCGAAARLLVGLGDAEGVDEGSGKGFKKSHVFDGTRVGSALMARFGKESMTGEGASNKRELWSGLLRKTPEK
jgi:hypothetical protein